MSYNLRRVCGISEEDLDRIRALAKSSDGTLSEDERARRERLMDCVRQLDEFRTAFWLKQGLDNPRLASFAVFNLRQARNGGFTDRPLKSDPCEILVRLDGVGEDAFE